MVIGGRAKIFATEDKFLKPHIQESNMFPPPHGCFFLVLGEITGPSAYVLGLQLMRKFVISVAKEGVWGRNI
jgi:hypothetical protein